VKQEIGPKRPVAGAKSWLRICSGAERNQFILTNQSANVGDDLAWVTPEENFVDRGETHAIAATNVFALAA
jgi:hypothetical protein